jgi:transcription-repair coupling factor (superfamily II helicase)
VPDSNSAASLIKLAHDNPLFKKSIAQVERGKKTVVLNSCDPAAMSFTAALFIKSFSEKIIWVLTDIPRQRERIAVELELWGIHSYCLLDPVGESSDGSITDPDSAAERLSVLGEISSLKSGVIIASSDCFSSLAPSADDLQKARISLQSGYQLDPTTFTEQLVTCGFERTSIVHARGQFTTRGGIVDLFPWQSSTPIRIEFFDQEIESIREFDPDSQHSIKKLQTIEITLSETINSTTVSSYLTKDHLVIAVDECKILPTPCHLHFSVNLIDKKDSLNSMPSPLGAFEAGDFILQESKREAFFTQLETWNYEHWIVAMTFTNHGEESRFTELAGEISQLIKLRGELRAGFIIPSLKLAVLSSSELFGRYKSASSVRKNLLDRNHSRRAGLEEIQLADLVVHYEYGIGRFRGIGISDDGDTEEIHIEYRDGAILSVPLDQAHLIGKYIGLGGKTPELNKLGGASWKNIRKTAEKSILDYAAQILRFQAERETSHGYSHPPDSRWMWEFENSFHFTETVDQKRAIEETKRDMESEKPMDRLICGDVGFGKTEVAIRAAFKAATGGKQVAILAPTTVLAEQHWRNFRERMSDYPIRVDLLNRFRTPAETRETIQGLHDGAVDIVIGTHRLFSGDIKYKNLGLVVIDEEQRFGVKHKEKFKEMFRSIDILTLSATPIPRTLYMALMGARDMSTIDTPPPNRTPVYTKISPYDDRIIKTAIEREMKRGGQVFFLHNRVRSIEMMSEKIQQLVPEARIVVGHGQMEQDELEVVMRKFVNYEADILLATTIIESGIDIPNANTILIDRADRFGLADLYQLRGRVGRSGIQAYAILMLPADMITNGDARKRINAIKQYTALGSGFKIAMRDLEIRGAGNLLGTKQSGHIANVGFDLYCQLLRQSVDRLKGRPISERSESVLRTDFIALSDLEFKRGSADVELLPAYLPQNFITETKQRVTAYRELAECLNEKKLDELISSWLDRFGKFPAPLENLLATSRIKIRAAMKKISLVEVKMQKLILIRNGSPILLENRHPRLKSSKAKNKINEIIQLLEIL